MHLIHGAGQNTPEQVFCKIRFTPKSSLPFALPIFYAVIYSWYLVWWPLLVGLLVARVRLPEANVRLPRFSTTIILTFVSIVCLHKWLIATITATYVYIHPKKLVLHNEL